MPPATRAKSAMEEAPKPKLSEAPARVCGSGEVNSSLEVCGSLEVCSSLEVCGSLEVCSSLEACGSLQGKSMVLEGAVKTEPPHGAEAVCNARGACQTGQTRQARQHVDRS